MAEAERGETLSLGGRRGGSGVGSGRRGVMGSGRSRRGGRAEGLRIHGAFNKLRLDVLHSRHTRYTHINEAYAHQAPVRLVWCHVTYRLVSRFRS